MSRYILRNKETHEESGPYDWPVSECMDHRYEVLHSTELKDQAGKEIFEGRYIVCGDGEPVLVEFENDKYGYHEDDVFVELTQESSCLFRVLA